MSAYNVVNWFEVGTDDPEAAKRFYGELFGWTFSSDRPYTMVTMPGAEAPSGGLFDTGGQAPNYAVFGVQVENVADTVAKAEKLGAKIVVPTTTGDGGVTFAHLRDAGGNLFEVYSMPQ